MNSPMLSEATGGTDTQQFIRPGVRSPISQGQISQQSCRRETSLNLETYLIQAAQNNDAQEVQTWLDKSPDLDISTILDPRKYSLLHFAAFNNQFPGVILMISHLQGYLRRQQSSEEEVKRRTKEWINKQTDDGFTSLHFASYRGNIKMIEHLKELGADISIQNKHGMNVLHIAAQGDQPISLAYFKYEGISFEQVDVKGGTALHWAAFYGCEQAVNYLLAWNLDAINRRDNEGLTPLHLGCMSGNSRVVKRLLIKGADKSLKDHKGQTPSDIASDNEFANIERMLVDRQCAFIEYYNVKPGFKKMEQSRAQLYKFICLYGFCVIVQSVTFIVEHINSKNHTAQLLTFIILQVIFIIFFTWICWKNPGYLGQSQKVRHTNTFAMETKPLVKLLKQAECFEICPECEIIKPQRSKHCDFCDQCVGVYDHHCPWVNNCIGKGNHGVFYIFIIVLLANLIFSIVIQNLFILDLQRKIIKLDTITQTVFLYIFVGICVLICIIFVIPILLLFAVQSKNLLLGQTTYERYAHNPSINRLTETMLSGQNFQNNTKLSIKESIVTKKLCPYSIYNCFDMCCNNDKHKDYSFDPRTKQQSGIKSSFEELEYNL